MSRSASRSFKLCLNLSPGWLKGRRGLLNLGQTCFLNVVLQCFAHNPLLRNYFLGDKHNWKQCKVENCTCCEMDKLFTEVTRSRGLHSRTTAYHDTIRPRYIRMIPIPMDPLRSWPRHGAHLPSYQGIPNRTRTNSSSQLSIRFTPRPVGQLTFPVIASSTPLLPASYRATSNVNAVGTSRALWIPCSTSVLN